MSIPEATLTIKDGALGLVPQDTSGIQALIGTSSSGTANVVASYGDVQTLRDDLGTGPLVEAAALVLSQGGGPVVVVKATGGTAGSNGSVTHTGTGTSVMTVSGTPLDTYLFKVLIKTAAAAVTSGLGTFVYSLDNGTTYSDEIALPTAGTYLVPNTGLTLTFAAGTLVADDTYTFTSTGPAYTLTNLNTALTALLAASQTWFMVHAVGVPADASASAAVFSALDTALIAAESSFRYAFACMQAADDTDANLISAFSALSSTRVGVCAGFAYIVSPLSGMQYKRGASWAIAARASRVSPATDLGEVAQGALTGVASLLRDERITPGLDANRFSTLRTHVGEPGFFITNARIMSSPTSDFRYWQHRRVMDIASTTVRSGQLQYLNSSVRIDAETGLINENDARAIEKNIEAKMRATVTQPGYASDCSVTVDRTVNMLTTETLKIKYRVVPLGYAKTIQGEIGFANPLLAA